MAPSYRPQRGSDLYVGIDIDVGEQTSVATAQLTLRQRSACYGLAADEWLPHDSSVALPTISVTSPGPTIHNQTHREASFTLARECEAGFTLGGREPA